MTWTFELSIVFEFILSLSEARDRQAMNLVFDRIGISEV